MRGKRIARAPQAPKRRTSSGRKGSSGRASSPAAVRSGLARLADRKRAALHRGFFKTGPGEYGEGDEFLGVKVPDLRRLAREHGEASLSVLRRLIGSPVHEERLIALLILVAKYSRGGEEERRRVFDFYLENTGGVNNWDLVDLSAGNIVGEHLAARDKALLYKLAESEDLWERRISIIATSAFIKRGEYIHTFRIAAKLLGDKEDLIHKAAGWMLREVGKRDPESEERFLKRHYKRMPRTMLRYAIERFPERKRLRYLKGDV